MKNNDIICILETYFRLNKKRIPKSQIDVDIISHILLQIETDSYELNTKSILLHEALFIYIETETDTNFLLDDIQESLNQVESFFEKKK